MRVASMLAALTAVIGLTAAVPAFAAAPKDGEKSGDWMFQCPKDAKQCHLVQTLTIDQNGKQGRLLQLTLLPQDDKSFILHALLPLGLHIPAGVAVKVDDNKGQRSMILQRCTAIGCEAAMKVDDAMLSELKKGTTLKVGFNTAANGKTMVAPASLKGLGDALSKLK